MDSPLDDRVGVAAERQGEKITRQNHHHASRAVILSNQSRSGRRPSHILRTKRRMDPSEPPPRADGRRAPPLAASRIHPTQLPRTFHPSLTQVAAATGVDARSGRLFPSNCANLACVMVRAGDCRYRRAFKAAAS